MQQDNAAPHILDVRTADDAAHGEADMRAQIIDGLRKPAGQKTLPTMLLYDERGLQLYDVLTSNVPEYYLFAAEEEILKHKADEVVQLMLGRDFGGGADGDADARPVVLELGAG